MPVEHMTLIRHISGLYWHNRIARALQHDRVIRRSDHLKPLHPNRQKISFSERNTPATGNSDPLQLLPELSSMSKQNLATVLVQMCSAKHSPIRRLEQRSRKKAMVLYT